MSVTLKDLMDKALSYADFPKDSLDVDQRKHLIGCINQGLQRLWEAIVDSQPEMVMKSTSISVAADDEDYDLPVDFYKAIKVYLSSGSRRYRMEKFKLDELDGYPKPLTSGTVELWYAPVFDKLKTEKSIVPGVIPNGWEDYGALHAAVTLLDDEGSDSSKKSAEREALMQTVRQVAGERDSEPESIADYYSRYEQHWLKENEIRYLRYRILGSSIYFIEVDQGGV